MKAIVHIGAPKAGSSAIQSFLFKNRDEIANRGFQFHRNFEKRGSQIEYAMAALARCGLLPPRKSQRLRYGARTKREMAKQLKPVLADLKAYPERWPGGTAVFSSEHLMAWMKTPELVRALDETFSEVFDEVRYVMYLRDPFEHVLSLYSEDLKRGKSLTFDELIDKREGSLLHWPTVELWQSTVGREHIDVRLLDKDFLGDGGLIEDFCKACGFSAEGLTLPGRVNESLSAAAMEAVRMLNRRIPGLHPDGGINPLRKGLVNALLKMDQAGPRLALSPAQWARVEAHVGESNEALRAAYFPERETLFSPNAHPPAEIDMAELRENALDLMVRLVIDLRLREIAPLGPKMVKNAVTRKPGSYEAE